MFITQVEICKRLNISRPTHNRLRKLGTLPNPYPGVQLYWWPAVMSAVQHHVESNVDAPQEPLPRFLAKGASR